MPMLMHDLAHTHRAIFVGQSRVQQAAAKLTTASVDVQVPIIRAMMT
jgi:hypothetical protein